MKKLLSVVLSLSMILSLFVCYIAVSAETVVANVASDNDGIVRIEAETGEKSGTATESTNANPSGGKAVGGIGGGSTIEQESYVLLKVNAPKAGRYVMTLAVNSADGATSGHNLSINGKAPVTLSYPGSAAWIPVDVMVELEEGENTVKVSGIPGSGAWARLDYIEVDFSKIIKRYEAEDGDVVGNNTYRADHNDASGGKFVAGLGGGSESEQNGSTTMTVNVPAAGVYTIKLRVKSISEYLTEAGSGNNLTINGETPITLAYPISETFIYHEVSVSLNAGDNTVKVSGIPGSAAWAQLDCIDVYVPVELYEEETTDIVQRYEAEEGVLDGANVSAEEAASGGYKVGGLGGSTSEQRASVTMTVTVPKSGTYTIKLRTRSAAGANTGHNLSINGGAPQTLSYTASATFIYHAVQVELNGGENAVKVSGIPGSGAWGFLDCIDVYIPEEYFVTDFSALSAAIEANKALYEDTDFCANAERAAFEEAYENALSVLSNEEALQYQADGAAAALVSAANALSGHTDHVASETYSFNEDDHWQLCTNGCGEKLNKAPHNYAGGTCVCGKACPHDWSDADGICNLCGTKCQHDWSNKDGVCANCGLKCNHNVDFDSNNDGTHKCFCADCGKVFNEAEACEPTEGNFCGCGYDCTADIAEDNFSELFDKVFNDGESDYVAPEIAEGAFDNFGAVKGEEIDGIKYMGFNLEFTAEKKIFLRHHILLDGNLYIQVGADEAVLTQVADNYYYFEVEVEIGKLAEAHEIIVDGTTVVTASVYSYMKTAFESGTLDAEQTNLLNALYAWDNAVANAN